MKRTNVDVSQNYLYFSTEGGEIQWLMTCKILDRYWKTLGISTFLMTL